MGHLGRRAFLIVAGMFSPPGLLWGGAERQAPGAAPSTSIRVEDFLALSTRLTGRTGLDQDVARLYLAALLSVPENIPVLSQLVELSRSGLMRTEPTSAQVAMERAIIAAWYTGTYDRDGQRHLATHTGALMWSALGQPAPGTCTGPTGTWSRAPQG